MWLAKRIFPFLSHNEHNTLFYAYHVSYIASILSYFFDTQSFKTVLQACNFISNIHQRTKI